MPRSSSLAARPARRTTDATLLIWTFYFGMMVLILCSFILLSPSDQQTKQNVSLQTAMRKVLEVDATADNSGSVIEPVDSEGDRTVYFLIGEPRYRHLA